MLCYRCGSHVPDSSESCATCGQKLDAGGVRQATATFSRRRPGQNAIEGAPFQPGDKIGGRYEVKDTSGVGPVGFVFRAIDQQSGAEVAVKVINARLIQSADERRHFSKILTLARKLSHPNLVRVYEEGEDRERPFYTMQFLEGLSLRRIIDLRAGKGHFFSLREVEPILGQMAAALNSAESIGPHSAVKPDNVAILPDLLKLTDYGLSLAMPRVPFIQAVRARNADAYLAPEYAANDELDLRADVYSLGVIIGEMLSGKVPQGSVPELSRINPEVPPSVEMIYRKALSPHPKGRFQTATEFFDAFAEVSGRSAPPPLKPKTDPAPTPRPLSRGLRPPVVEAPQPEPQAPVEESLSALIEVVDIEDPLTAEATQQVDPSALPSFPSPTSEGGDTQAMAYEEDPFEPPARNRSWLWFAGIVLLVVSGLGFGAVGGFLLLKLLRPPPVAQQQAPAPVAIPAPVAPAPVPAPEPSPTPEEIQRAQRAAEQREAEEEKALERQRADQQKLAEEAKRQEASKPVVPAKAEPAVEPPPEKKAVPVPDEKVETTGAAAAGSECPEGTELVPGGPFRMGTAQDDALRGFDERILASVNVGPFCIDRFEHPNRRGAMPLTDVGWADAKRLCEEQGKRLCAEEEWEKACKGSASLRFPYGNTFDPEACNTETVDGEDRSMASSGRFARCRSAYGISDLSGNVAEWTSSAYAGAEEKAQKGGSFAKADAASRCSARKSAAPSSRSPEVGFRCCADLR